MHLHLYLYLYTPVVGYSVVTHIPRGATNLDIRQYAPNDNKDDDIYLGKSVT